MTKNKMADTDTSDEAAFKYYRNWVGDPEFSHIKMWQECRRRCEAQMEERERQAFYSALAMIGVYSDFEVGPRLADEWYREFKEGK